MSAQAQGPKPRLAAAIESTGQRAKLPGSRPAQATYGVDQGALPASTALPGITLALNRSPAQQADLDTLLTALQDPKSPQFHHWLTPDQFATRFGVADADLARVQTWLQSQGFKIDSVARSRDRITFDGTAGQVANAFGTEIHQYAYGKTVHFAPNSDLSLPSTLAPMVTTVLHLADFRAHSFRKNLPRPAYTSAINGNDYLTPADVATMYDVNSTYSAGFTGAGQSIAILGQSYVDTAPVAAFQAGAGLKSNTPTLVLVPNTGVPGIDALGDGDEGESQIDLEYATGMAPAAQVFLVYTGDSPNHGVFDSLSFAIDEDVAPVISGSYGECELEVQADTTQINSLVTFYNDLIQQANTQGQTVIFSTGDSGSTSCYGYTDLSNAQQESPAASFPASVPAVVAAGGLQMQAGTFYNASSSTGTGTSGQYWQTATGTDVTSSLKSYVPETIWNEDNTTYGIASAGGGTSILFAKPSWQASLPSIATTVTNRLLPDISLQASTISPGYVYCTSDPADLAQQDVSATCTNGLRGPSGGFARAGGTSFSAPILAGMIAVLNQAKNSTGQGNLNQALYTLAANSATYASVFHDITTGTNACTAGTTFCSTAGASVYAATEGYDEASGLGSLDFANLVAALPNATSSTSPAAALASSTTVSAATLTPASSTSDLITISVAGASGGAVPTGTVSLLIDAATTSTVTLTNGQATFSYPGSAVAGAHVITALYLGDSTYLPSRGSVALTLAGSTAISGSFTLSAPNISVATNGVATGNLVITPAAGYTGTIAFSLAFPTNAPTLCYTTYLTTTPAASNVTLAGSAGPVTANLVVAEGTDCTTAALHPMGTLPPPNQPAGWPEGVAFAGLLFAGCTLRRSRKLGALLAFAVLAVLGLGLSGCGGSTRSVGANPTTPTTQSYTATLTGVDTLNPSITASTTFTITVQ